MRVLLFFLLPLLLIAPLQAQKEEILLNNQILAQVNGKTISTLDVAKRMNFLFYQLFPNLHDSLDKRYEFYQNSWKDVLKEMIDKELILADAEEKKLPISDGDVREEMEEMLGPNVIFNIDRLGLSYDEVWKMVQNNITVRRMLHYKVNSKAMIQIHPQDIENAYPEFAQRNAEKDQWKYRFITIQDTDPAYAKKLSETAEKLLRAGQTKIEDIEERLKEKLAPTSKIQLSKIYENNVEQIGETHQKILMSLQALEFSPIVEEWSRSYQNTVFRIFYLFEIKKGKVPSFSECEERIKAELLENFVAMESEIYIEKLRKYYGIDEIHMQNTEELFALK